MCCPGLDWDKKIDPGIFLVQAAHHHFELYIYIYIQEEKKLKVKVFIELILIYLIKDKYLSNRRIREEGRE